MRLAVPLLAAWMFAMPVSAATPSDSASLLQQAEGAMDDLAFDQAMKLYQRALSVPGTREERARAYRGLGLAEAYLGHARAAREAFETMLLIDPDATVNRSLGPKITRPFNEAKEATRKLHPEVRLDRDERSGSVTAELSEPVEAVDSVVLYVEADGETQTSTARPPAPARIDVPAWIDVKAWAEAVDEGRGTLFSSASAQQPVAFPATARPPPQPAVVAAVEDATQRSRGETDVVVEAPEHSVSDGSPWPWIVGGVVVAAAGGAAAAMLMQPQPLAMPAADRTGRLP